MFLLKSKGLVHDQVASPVCTPINTHVRTHAYPRRYTRSHAQSWAGVMYHHLCVAAALDGGLWGRRRWVQPMETSQRRQESLQQQPTRVGPVGERGQWAMGGWGGEKKKGVRQSLGERCTGRGEGVQCLWEGQRKAVELKQHFHPLTLFCPPFLSVEKGSWLLQQSFFSLSLLQLSAPACFFF